MGIQDRRDREKSSRSRRHFEVYVARVDPVEADPSQSVQNPITQAEWDAVVAGHDDLMAVDRDEYQGTGEWQPSWKFRSYPEGTPLFFDHGAIYIVRDDSETISRLHDLAEALQAIVVSENGEVFEDVAGAAAVDEAAVGQRAVPLNREVIRRRQILLFLGICLIVPALVGYWFFTNSVGIVHWLAVLISIGLGGYAAKGLFETRYSISKDPLRSRWIVVDENRSSTDDTLLQQELDPRELSGLELVWFVLDYPARRKIQFHVRGRKQPSVVLLETSNEKKARDTLSESSRLLGLRAFDRLDEGPVKDIPKEYQLTPAEKKPASMKGQVILVVVMLAIAGGLFSLGATGFAYGVGGLAVVIAAGNAIGRFLPDGVPAHYRDRC